MTSSKLISGESLTEYSRWELPDVQHGSRRRAGIEDVAGGTLKPLTAEELERIQQEAHREGHELGRREGLEAGKKEIQATLHRLEQVIRAFAEPLADLDETVERELMTLAVAIARQIIRRELKTEPGQVVAVVREALAALPANSRRVHIHLHPEDAVLVREAFAGGSGDEASWRVVDEPMLSRGGCRIAAEHSQIDATVEQRIAAIVTHILGGERRDDRGDDTAEA